MPDSAPASIRSLAESLGLSHTTVSEALRNHSRVSEKTRRRVQEAARAAGYRVNPLVSSVLREVRRTRSSTFRGVIAAINLVEPNRPVFLGPFLRDLLRGAAKQCAAFGFKLERINTPRNKESILRLDRILQARGIRGMIILPAWNPPDFTHLAWRNYSGVYTDYLIDQPALHSVCPDHHRAMTMAMERLHDLGFRRPGLVLPRRQSERVQHRWVAAFLAARQFQPDFEEVPLLVPEELTARVFRAWFEQHRPDVVLGHRGELVSWMESCGARVPRTHGFCCLNVSLNSQPCAGVDLQPYHIGEKASEVLIAQLNRNEFGVPGFSCNLTVPARWCPGPTLARRIGKARPAESSPVRWA